MVGFLLKPLQEKRFLTKIRNGSVNKVELDLDERLYYTMNGIYIHQLVDYC
jgi:hypothetical protein